MRHPIPHLLIVGVALLLTLSARAQAECPPLDNQQARNLGHQIATDLLKSLKGRLKSALAEKDIYGAIDVCSKEAESVTAAVNNKYHQGVSLKRVTSKPRNPRNRPTAEEKGVLQLFETGETPNDPAEPMLVRGRDTIEYYKPIRVAPLCLTCHGAKKSLAPKVSKIISELYPDDEALGYQEGDFRGLVHVTLPNRLCAKE